MVGRAASPGRGRVALFEDEAVVAMDLEERLSRLGLDVVGAWSSAEEGLRTLAHTSVDLVLMDITLQGAMTGIDAARLIVARHGVPVVFLTAHADAETVTAARATGASGFLVKPVQDAALQGTLMMAIENGRLAGALRAANVLLQQRQDELQRINTALDAFASTAAHEMRTPVTSAQVFLELLELEGPLNEPQREHVASLRHVNDRLLTLTEDFLRLARLRGVAACMSPVDLNDVLVAVREDAAACMLQSGGTLHIEAIPGLVRGNADQLHRLFLNLVTNAFKFRRPGVCPDVRIHAALQPDRTMRIEVVDNGIGFRTEEVSRLFHPLSRLHGRDYEGSGLGLAMCAAIVARHGGTIDATGVPGAGARFRVVLPTASETEGTTAATRTRQRRPESP
jgi:signal transduction histidine kinase